MRKRGKRRTPEQIIRLLRQAETEIQRGVKTAEDFCRENGVHPTTFSRWRRQFGDMRPNEARRLKALEEENSRLKRMVADLTLDIDILKHVALGNF